MSWGMYEGGPLDGLGESYPVGAKGLLLVNRPAGEVVIYDHDPARNVYVARPVEPEIADRAAPKNRYRAALEPNYGVVAYDAERMPSWGR